MQKFIHYRVASSLHMDLGENVKNFSLQSTVIFTTVMCVFIMLACLKFSPTSVGVTMEFGSLMLGVLLGVDRKRIWLDPDPENDKVMLTLQIVGGTLLLIIYTASIAPILLFVYKCKIVRNAFSFWNGRAYCALLRGMEFAQTEEGRTTYNLLFKDHCKLEITVKAFNFERKILLMIFKTIFNFFLGILLDLLDCLDQMYSFTLESFFALQVVSLFFQMYFFFRTGSQTQVATTSGPIPPSKGIIFD